MSTCSMNIVSQLVLLIAMLVPPVFIDRRHASIHVCVIRDTYEEQHANNYFTTEKYKVETPTSAQKALSLVQGESEFPLDTIRQKLSNIKDCCVFKLFVSATDSFLQNWNPVIQKMNNLMKDIDGIICYTGSSTGNNRKRCLGIIPRNYKVVALYNLITRFMRYKIVQFSDQRIFTLSSPAPATETMHISNVCLNDLCGHF